jgi:hypothetical protein
MSLRTISDYGGEADFEPEVFLRRIYLLVLELTTYDHQETWPSYV